MAVVLIIGPFFAGHLRPSETTQGRASMLANMRYHTAVIISLFTACGTLASSSRKLMRLGAHAERILELEDTAKEISSGACAVNDHLGVPPETARWLGIGGYAEIYMVHNPCHSLMHSGSARRARWYR